MNNENVDLEFIDRYIKNELNTKELILFEKRLKDDKDFEELYLFIKSLKQGIRNSVLKDKINLLKEYELQIQNKKNKFRRLKWFLPVAAIAAAFLLLVFYVPDMMHLNKTNKVSLDYFETYPAHVLKRSSKQNVSKLKQKAYSLYGISSFKEASVLLAELCDSGDKKSCFYTGVALLGNGEPQKALKFFNIDGLGVDKEVVYWYKGLCYWNNSEKIKAKDTWNRIDSSIIYIEKVKKIIAKD